MAILFVCRGNMFRSQAAEAFFNQTYQKFGHPMSKFLVESCVTWVKKEDLEGRKLKSFPELEQFLEVMKEKGIDISENVCKPIMPELVNWVDKIIVMAEKSECPDYLLESSKVSFWDVENPNIGITKEHIKEVVEQIKELVLSLQYK